MGTLTLPSFDEEEWSTTLECLGTPNTNVYTPHKGEVYSVQMVLHTSLMLNICLLQHAGTSGIGNAAEHMAAFATTKQNQENNTGSGKTTLHYLHYLGKRWYIPGFKWLWW
jgi:hypothetical protein